MGSVFYRTTFISASSTSESSESKWVINSEEITIEDFTKKYWWLENSKSFKTQIYQNFKFDLFKTDFTIKTKERDFSSKNPLKLSNSFLKNPYKNIKTETINIFIST